MRRDGSRRIGLQVLPRRLSAKGGPPVIYLSLAYSAAMNLPMSL